MTADLSASSGPSAPGVSDRERYADALVRACWGTNTPPDFPGSVHAHTVVPSEREAQVEFMRRCIAYAEGLTGLAPAASGAVVPAAEVREREAAAWDQGMRTGTSRAMRHMSDEPDLPLASADDNPFLDGEGP